MSITQNKDKNNWAIPLKGRNGRQSSLYATHCLSLIIIPMKLHEDIPNGYRIMVCT